MENKAKDAMASKTPKNLTNNKLDSDNEDEKINEKDIDDIDDETINPDIDDTYEAIEDFYDNENTPNKRENA